MFYFGGMTLGYLDPPETAGAVQDGGNKAERLNRDKDAVAEKVPGRKGLLARANWFNLYW